MAVLSGTNSARKFKSSICGEGCWLREGRVFNLLAAVTMLEYCCSSPLYRNVVSVQHRNDLRKTATYARSDHRSLRAASAENWRQISAVASRSAQNSHDH